MTEDGRPGRKTAYTWRFVRGSAGWICIDTLVPNRVVAEALAVGGLPGLPFPSRVRAEVPIPQGSRLDFVLEAEGKFFFLEIKSVTWVEDGVALFPDGVTSRGRRHLEHLRALVEQGHQAWNVFVVQRQDAQRVAARRRRRSGLCPGTGHCRGPRGQYHGFAGKNRAPGNYPCVSPPL